MTLSFTGRRAFQMAAQGEGHSKWLHREKGIPNGCTGGRFTTIKHRQGLTSDSLTGSHYPNNFTLLSKHSHAILTHQASPNDLP